MTAPLFGDEPYRVNPEPETAPDDGLGQDARRTLRQHAQLSAGSHPVTNRPLHDDAPPVEDRTAPGPRCGNCAHIDRHTIPSGKTFLKCNTIPVTGGPGTDLRRWWPACYLWEPQ